MTEIQNFISGIFRPSQGDRLDIINPATESIIGSLPDSSKDEVDAAVLSAQEAFPSWSQLLPEKRSEILLKIADLIDMHHEELAELESKDQGKPKSLAIKMDIPRASHNFRFFASAILHNSESAFGSEPGIQNVVQRKAVGVAALISPWNLPLYLLTWKIAPALATGNTVICKPSELTSLTAFRLAELMLEAGVPPGVCNFVFGTGQTTGAALISHPKVDLISFTGGTATGSIVYETAAKSHKKVSLELGGKNPAIVLPDVDLDEALPKLVKSCFLNQGEICLCTSRIFVPKSLSSEFIERFRRLSDELIVGDPLDSNTFMGPLVSADHKAKVMSYITDKTSGELILGQKNLKENQGKGFYFYPSILLNPDTNSAPFQEEIFGPVVTISEYEGVDEAITLANYTKYGLSATIWGKDISAINTIADSLDCGQIWVNTWLHRDLRTPFGGSKASGLGREGGEYSLEFFTEAKNICYDFRS